MNERLLSPADKEAVSFRPEYGIVSRASSLASMIDGERTGKLLCLLRRYGSQMPQIALIAHQHDHNVRVGVVPQLFQPSLHVLVRLVLRDVVNE